MDMMNEDQSQGDNTDNHDQSPLDEIIGRVDSYIKDPKLVTPETLQGLKTDLEDLKSVMDEEETPMGEKQDSGDSPGLAIMIGRHK